MKRRDNTRSRDKVVAVSISAVQAYKELKKKYPKEETGIFYMPTEEETVTLLWNFLISKNLKNFKGTLYGVSPRGCARLKEQRLGVRFRHETFGVLVIRSRFTLCEIIALLNSL